MLETMDRAPVRTKEGQEPHPVRFDDLAGESVAGTIAASAPLASKEPGQTESALAYELLLPNAATAIASIGVAGGPTLSRLQRDGTTMNWCELNTGGSSADPTDPADTGAPMASDGRSLPFPSASLDCVILHGTLDHWKDAPTLLAAVRIALKPGGVVAISVVNGLEPANLRRRLSLPGSGDNPTPTGKPRSLWGYRRLLRRCGLTPTASYFVLRKPGAAPSRIISTNYAPSTAFFSHPVTALTGPKRLLMRGLNAINLLPHVQSRFLILARK